MVQLVVHLVAQNHQDPSEVEVDQTCGPLVVVAVVVHEDQQDQQTVAEVPVQETCYLVGQHSMVVQVVAKV
jgi:hypothetical protein